MNDEIKEIKIITLGDIFKNIETEDKAFMFLKYIKGLQNHITNLQKENEDYKSKVEKAIEDIEFCFKSIKQEADMSKDERTRHEMRTCLAIFNETLKSLKNGSDSE